MQGSLVTAIIPTRNRPGLLMRAVRGALSQTHRDLEVVVVIDGPDPATVAALGSISDTRLQVVELRENVGSADARNIGVQHAKGEWVAFLDDDDEWMPQKIERQLDCAKLSKFNHPVVACRVIGRTPHGDFIWPRRFPRDKEPLCEYLFARNSWFRGEGQIQTSMIFAQRQLMLTVPFTSGMSRNDDSDWYVRIGVREDVGVEFVDSPLAIWYVDEVRPSVSRQHDWRGTHAWLKNIQRLITRRAYAGFLATNLAGEAHRQRAWTAFPALLSDMFRCGEPRPIDLAIFLGNWAMPESQRSRVRGILCKKQ
jgi:glycosyltransferase involved in cell wall biosynthesis